MEQSASGQKPRILVVDDERYVVESWAELLGDEATIIKAYNVAEGRRAFESQDIDVAILDVRMPDGNGLDLLAYIQEQSPYTESIIVSGHADIPMAVEAMRRGAFEFFTKPVDDLDQAQRRIEAAFEKSHLRRMNAGLQARLDAYKPGTELIGDTAGMGRLKSMIDKIADSSATVLVCGESGTGKELAARALHARGSRATAPFIAVNCGALSETLIDSELFGHERGAFTGAVASHKGLFEAADGGVLFLDEIGDVPLPTQVRLLRVLQEGEVRPVGSTRSRKVNVRVLAATNVDLATAMREGSFREDLYYRLSTFRLDIPPLRDRPSDIPLLAQHILGTVSAREGRSVRGFSPDAMAALQGHRWPGNVRELANVVEHAITLCQDDEIDLQHLPGSLKARSDQRPSVNPGDIGSFSQQRGELVEGFEKSYLENLLELTEGNLSEAARRSGIDRSNLRRLLKRHDLDANRFRRQAV